MGCVCRRWRCVVFASMRRLDLRLFYTPEQQVKKNLGGSAPHLRELRLRGIPHCGYISPEAMATSPPALTKLESLSCIPIPFHLKLTNEADLHLHLHAFSSLLSPIPFKDDSEYLEPILAQINSSLFHQIEIAFSDPLAFDTPSATRCHSGHLIEQT